MNVRVIGALTAAAATVAVQPTSAQQAVLTERNVSLQLARTIADGALARCQKDGYDISVVIVDRTGQIRLSFTHHNDADTNNHEGQQRSDRGHMAQLGNRQESGE